MSKLSEEYLSMKAKRSPFESRALLFADMTLPYLMTNANNGMNKDKSSQHGWTGLGASLVNYLANKIVITLFPAQQPFFATDVSSLGDIELEALGITKDQIVPMLAELSRKAMTMAEETGFRYGMVEALKHLIVTGNVCLRLPANRSERVVAIPMTDYVTQRNSCGVMIKFILSEKKILSSFSFEIQEQIRVSKSPKRLVQTDMIELYTKCVLVQGDVFEVTQYADDILIGDIQKVDRADLPFLPIPWKLNYNEDYGRGLVEDNQGDIFIHQYLSEARSRGVGLMTDIKFLIKQGAILNINEFVKSRTGDVMYGNADDITTLQLGAGIDLRSISESIQEYEQRLGYVFMMQASTRRDAERVTAYEVRSDAIEADQVLGGTYSMFDNLIQRPLANWYLGIVGGNLINKIKPVILTGLAALGAMAEMEKLDQLNALLAGINSWPEVFQQKLIPDSFIGWCSEQLQFTIPFFKSDQDMQEAAQGANEQAQMNEAGQTLTKGLSGAIPDLIKQ